MIRARTSMLLPAAILLAFACNQAPATRETTPRVVFMPASGDPAVDVDAGLAVGPEGRAPEVVLLDDVKAETPARKTPVKRPSRGPEIIYKTVYVEANETVAEPEPGEVSAPEPVEAPVIEPDRTPVEPIPEAEPQPGSEPAPRTPDPVATTPPSPTPTTFPDGGSTRAEDAVLGAAVGAGIGAILGGRNGAISGGIGGAVGGAIGGRSGGILGGVLGGTSSRGRLPRRGGGCFAPGGTSVINFVRN